MINLLREVALVDMYLKRFSWLAVLSEESLSKLLKVSETRYFKGGQLLFEEADVVEQLYLIVEGSVKLFKVSTEGRELIIKVATTGELCGCESLFNEERYLMSAMVQEDTKVIVIPAEEFKQLLLNELNETGLKMLESFSCCIKQLIELVESLAFKDVEMRILNKLYEIANQISLAETVNIRLTHQDIASMVGSVREVVSRTMSKLKKKGVVIESNVKGFWVDKKKLTELLWQRYTFSN